LAQEGGLMAYGRPDKPAKIRGATHDMTITTLDEPADAYGMATPAVGSTKLNVPVKLDTLSPAESVRLGHDVDETVYRVSCPVRYQDGTSIVLAHKQRVTISSVEYEINGAGQPQGRSGIQHATIKKASK
jgi:hypothetical protein